SISDPGDYDTRAPTRPAHVRAHRVEKSQLSEEKLRDMLDELCRNIAAGIGLFREEISGVSTGLQNTEITAATHETRLTKVEQQLTALQMAQTQTRESMASQEDKRRWKNLKCRRLYTTSVPQTI
ncbi:Hypothetical predicted protein, partial [Pelobates cultripes]